MTKPPSPPTFKITGKGSTAASHSSHSGSHRKRHVDHDSHDEGGGHGSEELWLISYADLMTLLFGFFVILFSMSTLDPKKYEALKKGATEAFGGEYQLPTEAMKREIVKEMSSLGIDSKEVEVTQSSEGIELKFSGQSLFQSGSADLNPKALALFENIYSSINKSKDRFLVRVEGHTDDVPINSPLYPSNWELSSARANRVVRRFEELGYANSQLEAIGYGSSRPLISNRDAAGKVIPENAAKNRRVLMFLKRIEIEKDKSRIPAKEKNSKTSPVVAPAPAPQTAQAIPAAGQPVTPAATSNAQLPSAEIAPPQLTPNAVVPSAAPVPAQPAVPPANPFQPGAK